MENTTAIKNSGEFEFGEINLNMDFQLNGFTENNTIQFFIDVMSYPEKLQPKINIAIEEGKVDYIKRYGNIPRLVGKKWSDAGVDITDVCIEIDIVSDKTVTTSVYANFDDKGGDFVDCCSSDIPVDLAEFGIDINKLKEELKEFLLKEIDKQFF
ncbi:MAG: hypothetical protein LKJ13_03710 [Clostridia bacterium]|jgi:hypothetical protein|nr:hypothetical protein [Clostridia bacterium]MCI2001065.1 hypothetical protein [Clostridia bacterium]MCI2015664.1 hypothetical protein [Clostridia bacterium]